MKKISDMKNLFLCFLAIILLAGCRESYNMARVEGCFHGISGQMVFLEELSPVGSRIVDSIKTSANGSFVFKLAMAGNYPSFYNLRLGSDFVPLLVSGGETVDVDAIGNIYYNYQVSGSEGSALVRQFKEQTTHASRRMDSLMTLYQGAATDEQIQDLGREYGQTYIDFKRNAITFITHNCTSLASLLPLYQPMMGGKFIFDEPQDIVYYRMVGDSLKTRYPLSPYVRSLVADIDRVNNAFAMDSMVTLGMENKADFPDIRMSDIAGQSHSLSGLKGKVILLDFSASTTPELKILNRELVDTYHKYAGAGFEIFQVSLDKDKAEWIRSTSEQKLPWIVVCDLMGADSPAVKNYNLQTIPANFLIDKQGVIVGRNLRGEKLERELAKLLDK
ncbi:MAG: TlpA disulfide reductase family protein [Mucinivorans sp.]